MHILCNMNNYIYKVCIYNYMYNLYITYKIFIYYMYLSEKEMATHSSVLAWRIPGMVEPGGLPSMGSHRVGHNWSDLAATAAAVTVYRDFGAPQNKVSYCFHYFPIDLPRNDGTGCHDLGFLNVAFMPTFHSPLSLSSRGFLVPLHFLP